MSFGVMYVHTRQQVEQVGTHQVFRKSIGWMLLAWDLVEMEFFISEALLDPKVAHGKMPDTSKSSSTTDTNGS